MKAKKYPQSTSVDVMSEGGESAMFKHLFKSWRDKGQTQGLGATYNVGKIGNTTQSRLLLLFHYGIIYLACMSFQ